MTYDTSTISGPPVFEEPGSRSAIARRVGRNIGIVVSGNIAIAVLAVLTLGLNARALGASGLGVLALIVSTAALLDRIWAFQTWQPLVKLCADALAVGDRRRVGRLTTVGLAFDAASASAAAISGILLVILVGERLGMPGEFAGVAAVYMATLATRIADTPSGLLRLLDRFGILTAVRTGEAVGQFLVAALLFVLGAQLPAYVIGFAIVAVGTNVALLGTALRVAAEAGITLQVRGFGAAWSASCRDFWAFSWTLNLASTINAVRQRGSVLLIGALLGPAAVGIYHVAERVVGVLGTAMWSFHQALYPEAARLATGGRREDLVWFVYRVGTVCGAIGVLALLVTLPAGTIVLQIVGGGGYLDAYWPLVLLVGSLCISMTGIGLHSVVLVTAGPLKVLKAHLLPFLAVVVLLPLATVHFQIAGAAAAHIAYEVIWLIVMAAEFRRWLLAPTVGGVVRETETMPAL